jgi:hypothetical protein
VVKNGDRFDITLKYILFHDYLKLAINKVKEIASEVVPSDQKEVMLGGDVYRRLKEIEEALIDSIEDGTPELSLIGTMRDKTFGKIADALYQNTTV